MPGRPAQWQAAGMAVLLLACAPADDAPANSAPDGETSAMTTPAEPSASRGPPKRIKPITVGGITYRPVAGNADTDGQAGGFLGAFDDKGSLLWTLKIYENQRRPELEGDVQDVYFKDMTLEADGRIRIISERGQRFRVDVRTRTVTPLPAPVPDPDPDEPVLED